MNRDLAALIGRNLLGASHGALRPWRPSRFEPAAIDGQPAAIDGQPAAIDGQPPAAVESAHRIASASPIHSTGRDADGHRDPPRAEVSIVERASRRSGRALTNERTEERAEVGPPHTIVATVVQLREQEPPFGEEATQLRGTRATDRRTLSAHAARPPASAEDDGRHGNLPPPVIEVTIGRVDVRAILPPVPAPPARPVRSTTIPLEEYLRERPRGGR
jgi:hypothetical protein